MTLNSRDVLLYTVLSKKQSGCKEKACSSDKDEVCLSSRKPPSLQSANLHG